MSKNNTLKHKNAKQIMYENIPYLLLVLPGFVWLIFFHYVPITGIVLAFKNFNYIQGIFGSPWVGFKNFETFFKSNDCWRIMRNTIGYNLAGMLIVSLLFSMIVALLLYEVTRPKWNKCFQISIMIPNFISWVAVAYIVFIFLSPENGILNSIITAAGGKSVNWYSESGVWPFILIMVSIWKNAGFASLYFYAALLAIDTSLYEAAELDGAKKRQQLFYITIPHLTPMICMTLVMNMGKIIGGGMDLFYQVPMNSSAVYSTTDVIATYIYRGLVGGNVGVTAAVGLFQSVVGVIMLLTTNAIIKKMDPEQAVF